MCGKVPDHFKLCSKFENYRSFEVEVRVSDCLGVRGEVSHQLRKSLGRGSTPSSSAWTQGNISTGSDQLTPDDQIGYYPI